jgi:cell division protein FtsA
MQSNTQDKAAETTRISDITVSLDIGTSKICAIVAAPDQKPDSIKILGLGITESEGINRGVVVNIDKTVNAIKKVIDQAEQQSGLKIESVTVGIAGDHIESFQSRGIVTISSQLTEISCMDVERLLEDSRKISLPAEKRIIHVIPQDYIIDGQDGIIDPVGMSGVRMEANVHVVTGLATAIQNISRCVERAGLKVDDIVLEPLASSNAVLNEEEKEVGVALIDIGGGTTDIAIFQDNIIRWTSVFAIAGKQVTDDIRHGLGIIVGQADRIKKEYGHAHQGSILSDEVFMIPGIGGRKPMEATKSQLCQIIQPRMEEIFEIALSEIQRSGYANRLGAGIVVTGGTSILRGTDDLASEVFGMPVKIGMPSGITYSGLAPEIESPVYSTGVGLALYAMQQNRHSVRDESCKQENADTEEEPKRKKSIFGSVKTFLSEL